MKTSKKVCVTNPRVSGKDQELTGYSLPAQSKLLESYAVDKGFTVSREFPITETASKPKQRKIFNEMMDYVNDKSIKVIIVEKVDRLVRNFKDVVLVDEWLEKDEERQIHFVKDSLILHKNSRSQETLNWGIRVVFAKNYIDNLKEEVDKGVKEKLAQGWLPGSPPPGYKTIGNEGHKIHVIDQDVAPLVVKLFELYLDPSASLSTVTAEMKRRGLRTKLGREHEDGTRVGGRPYSRSHITKVLKNPFYVGVNVWKGVEYEGKQEQLISRDLFDAVQLKMQRKNPPKYNKHNPLFKGVFFCEGCGNGITWESQKGTWYGHCNTKSCGARQELWATEKDVEDTLKQQFAALRAVDKEVIEWTRKALRERHENDQVAYHASLMQLETRRKELGRMIDNAYDDKLAEVITREKYEEVAKKFKDEQKAITDQIERFDTLYASKMEYNLDLYELSQRAAEIYEAKNSVESRRHLIGELFSNLRLFGKKLEYEYSETVAAIAKKALEDAAQKRQFELENNDDLQVREAYLEAARTIWLGMRDSNPRSWDQNPVPYRLANPQYCRSKLSYHKLYVSKRLGRPFP